jgi:hypothetical protein
MPLLRKRISKPRKPTPGAVKKVRKEILPFRIATWNSRGSPAGNDDKMDVLRYLMNNNDVVLIQECGRLAVTDLPGGTNLAPCYFYLMLHAGAFNERCNSCIISNVALDNLDRITLNSSNGRSSTCGIRNGVVVATLHANASYDAACDVRGAIASLGTRYPGVPCVLGGDFNTEPIDLSTGRTRSVTVGSSSRGTDFNLVVPASTTHVGQNSNRTLDYFALSHELGGGNAHTYHSLGGSDHYPVMIEVRGA